MSDCKHGTIKGLCSVCDRKPDTVTLPRETDLSGTTRARIVKDGTVVLRHFNCDETNEFYLTAFEAKQLHNELTKAMEVKGE